MKNFNRPKPLRVRFDKIDGFILVLDGKTKHLVLFDYGLFDKTCNKIKYLLKKVVLKKSGKKSGIADSINHNFGEIRIDLCNSLPIQKRLTFHNVIIRSKSVLNKNKNEHYYNVF